MSSKMLIGDHQPSYSLTLRIKYFVFCFAFLILFCLLGIWQVQRYQYKKTLINTYHERVSKVPQPFLPIAQSPHLNEIQFQHVSVVGEYINSLTMFVENRIYHHEVGVEVLTPMRIEGTHQLLLVDRGWIKKSMKDEKKSMTETKKPIEDELPQINDVNDQQRIEGYLKSLDEYQFILGKNILSPQSETINDQNGLRKNDFSNELIKEKLSSPIIMQKIDLNDIARITQKDYFPYILRLDPSQSNGFVRDWDIYSIMPAKHLGYAIQWFLMALVVVVGYFIHCFKRKEAVHDQKIQ
jgi:surfeit locus 1 family protein